MRQLGSLSCLTSLLSVMFSGFIHVVAGTQLGTFSDPVSLFRLDPRDTYGAGGLEVAEASTLGSEAKVRLALGAVLVLRVSPSLPNSPFLGWGMEEAETVPLGLLLANPVSVLASCEAGLGPGLPQWLWKLGSRGRLPALEAEGQDARSPAFTHHCLVSRLSVRGRSLSGSAVGSPEDALVLRAGALAVSEARCARAPSSAAGALVPFLLAAGCGSVPRPPPPTSRPACRGNLPWPSGPFAFPAA